MQVEGTGRGAARGSSSSGLIFAALPVVIGPAFRPPPGLRHGHVQTILPALLPRRRLPVPYRRERLELPDGDFLDLDWLQGGSPAGGRARPRLALLTHGLEGDAEAGYIRGMARALHAAGWDVLAWTFRGCGREPNRLPRFYHAGETGDLCTVIAHGVSQGYDTMALVGFSLGGNLLLKCLGEAPAHPSVAAAAAFSVPVDLAASARALDGRRGNRLYLRRFLATLTAKVEAKARRFPEHLDATGLRGMRGFGDFDDRYTARLHGFRDAADYWTRSSARSYLPGIRVPTLLVNARDDPFLPAPDCFPFAEAEANPHLFFEAPAHGGHVGFVDFRDPAGAGRTWAERRAVDFLRARTAGDAGLTGEG